MSAIAELAEDRVVDGVYAVLKKEKLRTRAGASYLALELVGLDRPHLRARLERRRPARRAVQRGRRRARARSRGEVPRPAAARGARARAGGGRSCLARAGAAPRRRRAGGLRRVPHQRDPRRSAARARRARARGCAAAPRVSRDARRSPLVRRWTARAHGRRGDDLPRALAAPSAPPRRPPRRARRSFTTSGARGSSARRPRSGRPTKDGCSATCTSAFALLEAARRSGGAAARGRGAPRRSRGSHGGGCRALPREPARRRSRDETRRANP